MVHTYVHTYRESVETRLNCFSDFPVPVLLEPLGTIKLCMHRRAKIWMKLWSPIPAGSKNTAIYKRTSPIIQAAIFPFFFSIFIAAKRSLSLFPVPGERNTIKKKKKKRRNSQKSRTQVRFRKKKKKEKTRKNHEHLDLV